MSHLYSKNVYCVMTLLDHLKPNAEKDIIKYLRENCTKAVIVKEMGRNNDNPHYNIVCEYKNDQRMTRLNSKFKTFYENIPSKISAEIFTIDDRKMTTTKYLVKCKPAYNEQNLIGGYLTKEDDPRIVSNYKYDLEKIIGNWEKSQELLGYTRPRTIKFNEAAHFFAHVLTKKKLAPNKRNFKKIYLELTLNGYSFILLNKNIREIFFTTKHLMGKSKDLEDELDNLLTDGYSIKKNVSHSHFINDILGN